ncbi:type II toxin-antitoxin system HicA family toxin [Sphingomonas sp.]|jgi:predicted RNA binding protein YcfA (HicA-like mRNA interferase family)|uniref:type II toxin-antitoxin system HicA family toxin n=1 Tax=Sphingomonas sp. TaxID=28214 RepID=UPI002DED49BC|nr:type II toxin-antitoxin system HicA family toxin [Sphingomonas sp.]HEV2569847.1 type II toxin-antitoxin system HicA family toxin [Sphingomonas sp.]
MPRLPRLSGRDVIKALERLGFHQTRQRGSHVVMRRGERGCVVPAHKEVRLGTLSTILNQAGVSVEELLAALK